VNPLKFAHDLARFKQDLIEHEAGPDGLPAVLAGSYLLLPGGLAQSSGDPEQVSQAITEAIGFYNRAREAARRYYAAADSPEHEPP
jgi:hypothetical protein